MSAIESTSVLFPICFLCSSFQVLSPFYSFLYYTAFVPRFIINEPNMLLMWASRKSEAVGRYPEGALIKHLILVSLNLSYTCNHRK